MHRRDCKEIVMRLGALASKIEDDGKHAAVVCDQDKWDNVAHKLASPTDELQIAFNELNVELLKAFKRNDDIIDTSKTIPAKSDSENEMSADEEPSETATPTLMSASEISAVAKQRTTIMNQFATEEDESDDGSEHKMLEDRAPHGVPAPTQTEFYETSEFAPHMTNDTFQFPPAEDDSSDGSEHQMLEDQELTEAALMVMETLATSVLAQQIPLDGMDIEPIPYEQV